MDCSWLILPVSGGAVASCSITAVAASWRSALPIGRVMVVWFITMLLLFIRHRHTLLYIKRQCALNPLSNGIRRSNIEKSLPRQRHYIASRGVHTAIYVYAASVSETHHVLRYFLRSRHFIFLDGAKIRSFIETTKLFLRKFHFMSNFPLKNLHKSIFCYTFALEQ